MLNGDGGELRQRAATTSLPGKITEETATQHRMRMEKMREEDMQPVSWKAGVVVIILLMICCALGWHLILAHADHWIIDEINNGHVENVRAFLKDHEIHHINKLDNHGLALIHHAVESQQPEIVKILLEHGASANVKDEHQQTPLHLAVYHGLPEVAKVLVDAGAPVTAKDEDGRQPLEWAELLSNNNSKDAKRAEVVKILREAAERRARERLDDGLGEA